MAWELVSLIPYIKLLFPGHWLTLTGPHQPPPETTIPKYHRLGRLKNSHFFSNSSGGQKCMIHVSTNSIFGEGSLLGLKIDALSLCPHFSSIHMHNTLSCFLLLFYKDTSPTGLGLKAYDRIISKSPYTNTIMLGIRTSKCNFEENTILCP